MRLARIFVGEPRHPATRLASRTRQGSRHGWESALEADPRARPDANVAANEGLRLNAAISVQYRTGILHESRAGVDARERTGAQQHLDTTACIEDGQCPARRELAHERRRIDPDAGE